MPSSGMHVYRGPPRLYERMRRIVLLKCPVCGKGKPFLGLFVIRRICDACGYKFHRESGYFVGSIYFNYGATAGILVTGYFALEAFFGLTFAQQVLIWVSFSLLFPFWFLRYARSLWMTVDLMLSPPVEADFEVRENRGEGSV